MIATVEREKRGGTPSFLRPQEQRLIEWLLPRLPGAITPLILTGVGLLGAAVASMALIACAWSPVWSLLAAVGVGLNWFGNLFDGPLAHYRRENNPRQFVIDHTSDLFSFIVIIVAFGLSPFMSLVSCMTVLLCYLLFSCYAFIKAAVRHVRQSTFLGVGATEFRILMVIWACGSALLGIREPMVQGLSRVDAIIIVLAGLACLGLAYRAIADALQLSAEERAKPQSPAHQSPAHNDSPPVI